MKLRLRSPRELARLLLSIARRQPEDVEDYLEDHVEEWSALAEAHPGDAADILEALSGEVAAELLTELDTDDAAELLEELRDDLAADLLLDLPVTDAAEVLAEMSPEEAADVLAKIEDPETVESLLELLPDEEATEVRQLLAYPPDSAGGLMTTDIAVLPVGMTAGEAIERLRVLHEELENMSYVYIVDEQGRLEGVLSFRDLVFLRPGAGLDEAMIRNPVAVHTHTDREEVAELIRRYHLAALPVVDDEGKLVGMVTTDAVLGAVQEEASEDFAVAMGTAAEDSVYLPVRRSVRNRLPWIAFDVVLSSTVVLAVSWFEPTLDRFVVLASLMPLVARIGGDAGAQSLAVVIRALASGGIPGGEVRRVLGREMRIGVINGLVIGLLSGGLGATMAALRGQDPVKVGAAMLLAAWGNLILAGLAGAGIPLALRRLGFDPALGSNLFLTTATDLLGFAGFLAVATAIL
ncbi:MAG: magnesium transporter MgtE [Acidimicrobiia bacterium]|nr:MAG: magnesium transporter MgtE [Acidimicrobiia bacterium]